MAINRVQEDLPKNQAQEGARKQLSSSEKDLKKYREIILQGCLIAKTKRELQALITPLWAQNPGSILLTKYNTR